MEGGRVGGRGWVEERGEEGGRGQRDTLTSCRSAPGKIYVYLKVIQPEATNKITLSVRSSYMTIGSVSAYCNSDQPHFCRKVLDKAIYSCRGATGGGGCWRRTPPPPKFQTLAKDFSLIATHFTLRLRPCIISSFLFQIYVLPPLKITQLRP